MLGVKGQMEGEVMSRRYLDVDRQTASTAQKETSWEAESDAWRSPQTLKTGIAVRVRAAVSQNFIVALDYNGRQTLLLIPHILHQ